MLGLGLSRYGLHTIEDQVQAVLNLAAPTMMGEPQCLLRMFGYYRMFIRNFAKVAAPLNELKKRYPDAKSKDYSCKLRIPWTDESQAAYDELKHCLSSAPILAHLRYDRPFILYTDASNISFGVVLAQVWTKEDYFILMRPTYRLVWFSLKSGPRKIIRPRTKTRSQRLPTP
jgi:hypothetical protein